jgi:hypothetical protein
MDENPPEGAEPPRHRILTSHSGQQLEAKVLELMLQGWVRLGDIAVAKSVIDSEPPYLTQAMIQIGNRKKSEDSGDVHYPGGKTVDRRKE